MKKLFCVVAFLYFVGTTFSATIVSVQPGAWDDPTTWDCTCIPLSAWPGDDITIAHAVTYDDDITFSYYEGNSLTINNGASLTMTAGTLTMDAPAFFTFDGLLDIQNGDLIITSGGTKSAANASFNISSTGSVVISGNFDALRSSLTVDISGSFEVGGYFETEGSGGTVNVSTSGSLNLGSYVQTTGAASSFNIADGGQVEVIGDVTVANSGGTDFAINGNMDVGGSLSIGSGSSVTVTDGSLTVVTGIDTTGGGTIDTSGSGTVSTPTCTDPCDADVTIDMTLPVELLTFETFLEGSSVVLSWSTESELNNSHFSIERSIDQVNFEWLAEIDGNGTTTISKSYQWIDPSPSAVTFYRLSQTDFDGTTEVLGTKRVAINAPESQPIFYPNPVPQNGTIHLSTAAEQTWSIYAPEGQLLMMGKSNKINAILPSGFYYLKLEETIQKLIVK